MSMKQVGKMKKYQIKIEHEGKEYIGNAYGCKPETAIFRAVQRWREKRYDTYNQQTQTWSYKTGPGFRKKIKKLTITLEKQ